MSRQGPVAGCVGPKRRAQTQPCPHQLPHQPWESTHTRNPNGRIGFATVVCSARHTAARNKPHTITPWSHHVQVQKLHVRCRHQPRVTSQLHPYSTTLRGQFQAHHAIGLTAHFQNDGPHGYLPRQEGSTGFRNHRPIARRTKKENHRTACPQKIFAEGPAEVRRRRRSTERNPRNPAHPRCHFPPHQLHPLPSPQDVRFIFSAQQRTSYEAGSSLLTVVAVCLWWRPKGGRRFEAQGTKHTTSPTGDSERNVHRREGHIETEGGVHATYVGELAHRPHSPAGLHIPLHNAISFGDAMRNIQQENRFACVGGCFCCCCCLWWWYCCCWY